MRCDPQTTGYEKRYAPIGRTWHTPARVSTNVDSPGHCDEYRHRRRGECRLETRAHAAGPSRSVAARYVRIRAHRALRVPSWRPPIARVPVGTAKEWSPSSRDESSRLSYFGVVTRFGLGRRESYRVGRRSHSQRAEPMGDSASTPSNCVKELSAWCSIMPPSIPRNGATIHFEDCFSVGVTPV